jgi:hypothetical protein
MPECAIVDLGTLGPAGSTHRRINKPGNVMGTISPMDTSEVWRVDAKEIICEADFLPYQLRKEPEASHLRHVGAACSSPICWSCACSSFAHLLLISAR